MDEETKVVLEKLAEDTAENIKGRMVYVRPKVILSALNMAYHIGRLTERDEIERLHAEVKALKHPPSYIKAYEKE